MNLSDPINLSPIYSYKVTDDAMVHLFSEDKTWMLSGMIFGRLIPLIAKESKTVESILEHMIGEFAPERIFHAMNKLESDGIISSSDPARNPEALYNQILDEADDEERSNDPVSVSVKTCGLPPATVNVLKKALKSSNVNIKPDSDANIVILVTNDYLNLELEAEINKLDKQDTPWIVMKPVGTRVWIGPVAGGTACWKCLTNRVLDNRLGQHYFSDDMRESSIPPLSSLRSLTNAAMNLVASHIASIASSAHHDDLQDHILIIDPASLTFDRHFILQDPSCSCADALDQGDSFNSTGNMQYTHHEHNYRAASPSETYDRISRIVNPVTGLIPEINRSDEYDSTYIYYARHGFSIDNNLSSNRIMGKPSWACGKGATDIDARVSCIAEAVERYSAGYFGNEPVIRGRIADLDGAIDPASILLYSDKQYDERDAINHSRNDFHWVPERFDIDNEIEWVRYHSLSGNQAALVPARLTYLNYNKDPANDFGRADSNGCATGNTEQEAALFALFELIERDSVAIWWFNEYAARQVDFASFDDYNLTCIARSIEQDGRNIIALDITTDTTIPTFAAISWHSEQGDRIFIGYGTHLDPTIALRRAFNEVIQVAAHHRENPVTGDPVLDGWMKHNISELPFLRGSDDTALTKADFINLSSGSLQDDLNICATRLKECGLEVYAHVLTRGQSLLPTVRVIAPGLRHFWPRYAAGRLFDVPVRLGRVDNTTQEDKLNRLHYPL